MTRYLRSRACPLYAALTAACFVVAFAPATLASSAGMPWESPLQRLVQSLTGPVAKAIGIAAIVIAALGMAISEGGHTLKTFLKILLGLSIAFTAGTFGLQLVGFSGGLLL
jgi:type IV secretion system protein VirB2